MHPSNGGRTGHASGRGGLPDVSGECGKGSETLPRSQHQVESGQRGQEGHMQFEVDAHDMSSGKLGGTDVEDQSGNGAIEEGHRIGMDAKGGRDPDLEFPQMECDEVPVSANGRP